MKDGRWKWPGLLVTTVMTVPAAPACGQEGALTHATVRMSRALAPVLPPITPQIGTEGTYGLRVRVHYLEAVTSNIELRRHQYFIDDNLKTERPRTSIAWHFRLYF